MRLSSLSNNSLMFSAHYPVECEQCVSVYYINLHDLRAGVPSV